jgi:aromatic amino acid aminotransferase I
MAAVTDTQGATIPDPFTMSLKSNQIHGRRKKSEKNQWGVAAPARSSQFRHISLKSKPKAKRWDRTHAVLPLNQIVF